MNQAVTKVNDVGPVIVIVTKADVAHLYGRQYSYPRKWQEGSCFVGVLGDGMVQDGMFVNLGDLHGSAIGVLRQYGETYPFSVIGRKFRNFDDCRLGSCSYYNRFS